MTDTNMEKFIQGMYASWDWTKIPSHMWHGLKLWVEYGIPGGSFLDAVMRHDFYEAIHRADAQNKASIVDWAEFLAWYLPSGCHGSDRTVNEWQLKGGLRGMFEENKKDDDEERIA